MKRLLALLLLASAPASAQTVNLGALPVVILSGTGTCCGGATTETNVAALRIPGGSMGTNGAIDLKCLWTVPNSGNNKSFTTRFSTTSGDTSSGGSSLGTILTVTAVVAAQTEILIRNTATNAQSIYASSSAPFGSSATANVTLARDTSVDTFLNINATTASGAETITLNSCIALIMRAP